MLLAGWVALGAALPLALAVSGAGDAEHAAALLSNRSLFWNTYRPQLYHGIRPRLPHSLMTGLMWFGLNDYSGNNEIRHTCEQSDSLSSYSYTQHDGRFYAVQDLVDGKNNVKMTVSWLKDEDGRDWAVRVEGDAIDQSKASRTSVIYHFGLEGLGELTLEDEPTKTGLGPDFALRGSTPQLGEFRIRLVEDPDNHPLSARLYPESFTHLTGKTHFFGLPVATGEVWRIKDLLARGINAVASQLMQSGYTNEAPPDPFALFYLPDQAAPDANVWAFQKAFAGSGITQGGKWGFDIYFESIRSTDDRPQWTQNSLTSSLASAAKAYSLRFDKTLPLPAPFNTPNHTVFAQALTSNLLGGIGYYQGSSIVDRAFRHEYDEGGDDEDDEGAGEQHPELTEDRELLTATPSRSFFPRGFYWDEGFHLALIGEWDNDLSLAILKDWIALIDEDGWVAREQILGEESRSKVPQEFQTQYPLYANPPTLTMAVAAFVRRLRATADASFLDSQMGFDVNTFSPSSLNSEIASLHLKNPHLAQSYLESIYPALRRHYLWFRRTQKGLLRPYGRTAPSKTEAYRWRGRTADHVLTSGLDDYPRARPPSEGELHLDLLAWVGFFARTMGEISEYLGKETDLAEYRKHEAGVLANIDALHWSEEEKMYCDVSVDEEDESIHVCHRGYISLFPFLLGLIPSDSPHLPHILDLITSPSHLWSPYGIRSLSLSHPLFGKDENYWRGPIWIQMNWLALKALKEKYMVEGPESQRCRKVYDELRANVINNVFKEWQRTGYVWEQYGSEEGEGRRSHPFTGWTSLVVMIMTEKYS